VAGYDIYSIKSGKKLHKCDLFGNYNRVGRELELELIVSRMHPGFEFKENGNPKYDPKNPFLIAVEPCDKNK
jgi:hypothetical protein